MVKIIIWVMVAVLLLTGLYFLLPQNWSKNVQDHKNTKYFIDGEYVNLVNGFAETSSAPGSSSKIVTKYFGNEVVTDLNDDGREDVVFLLTQDKSGSGLFYYAVAALNTEDGYVGSQALFLGDRISPQSSEKGKGKIVVINYADRATGDDFSVAPSVGKSIWLLFDPQTMQFGEVVQDFEGEADPGRMSLGTKDWVWISALYNDGREVKPNSPGDFVLSFESGQRFSVDTDCNSVGGTYTAGENLITFSNIVSTLMFCEGSKERDFVKLLENTSSYHFTSKGELIFDLKFDSGSVIFR